MDSAEKIESNPVYTLELLCEKVTLGSGEYDEYSEMIADAAYSAAVDGYAVEALTALYNLSRYYETRRSQDIESIRDHADIALLAGEVSQYAGDLEVAIEWYKEAAQIDDNYDLPFHCMGTVYLDLGDRKQACNAFEREIFISPGNYYSYLILADQYEELGENKNVEVILKKLLERDTENIQALHKLILHYQDFDSGLDINLLRARIINAKCSAVKMDLFIWAYHMIQNGDLESAIEYLDNLEKDFPGISITSLLKAYIYGLLRMFSKRRQALIDFNRLNYGRTEFMKTKVEEFVKIFGDSVADQIKKSLPL